MLEGDADASRQGNTAHDAHQTDRDITARSSEVKNKQTGEQEAADEAYRQVIGLTNNLEPLDAEEDEIQIVWKEPGED